MNKRQNLFFKFKWVHFFYTPWNLKQIIETGKKCSKMAKHTQKNSQSRHQFFTAFLTFIINICCSLLIIQYFSLSRIVFFFIKTLNSTFIQLTLISHGELSDVSWIITATWTHYIIMPNINWPVSLYYTLKHSILNNIIESAKFFYRGREFITSFFSWYVLSSIQSYTTSLKLHRSLNTGLVISTSDSRFNGPALWAAVVHLMDFIGPSIRLS